METKWLTYEELGSALGITPASAKRLAIRRKWAKKLGNDGKSHVSVPIERLETVTTATDDDPSAVPSAISGDVSSDASGDRGDSSALIALQILREHIGRLEAEVSSWKDEAGRERARAAQVDALTAVLQIERNRAEELRQERDRWAAVSEAFHQQLVEQAKRPRGLLWWLRKSA